ncbi:MAG: Holliday junction branch migration protein RuvA [Acidobacteriota bacterium]
MIASFSGKISHKQANTIVIDVGGVGYEVSIPLSTFYEIGEVGSEISLNIFTHVREDALSLFGFKTLLEKDLFLLLTSVSGIGPKSAITALSGMSAEEMIEAIRQNNLPRLNSIPGIGKKTAERIVIELRDKAAKLSLSSATDAASGDSGTAAGSVFEDAVSALVNLGYQRVAAERALSQALKDGTEATVQGLLRRGLQLLAK